jgi:hypothetical protein
LHFPILPTIKTSFFIVDIDLSILPPLPLVNAAEDEDGEVNTAENDDEVDDDEWSLFSGTELDCSSFSTRCLAPSTTSSSSSRSCPWVLPTVHEVFLLTPPRIATSRALPVSAVSIRRHFVAMNPSPESLRAYLEAKPHFVEPYRGIFALPHAGTTAIHIDI